jgi:hypothetical protein
LLQRRESGQVVAQQLRRSAGRRRGAVQGVDVGAQACLSRAGARPGPVLGEVPCPGGDLVGGAVEVGGERGPAVRGVPQRERIEPRPGCSVWARGG